MSLSIASPVVLSSGVPLDTSPDKWGQLLDSSHLAADAPALREQMARDGYLFLRGLLDRDQVLETRRVISGRLRDAGNLLAGSDPMDCRAVEGSKLARTSPLARDNPALMRVLYDGPMMAFYERFLGGQVRHFDFTWFRAISPGNGTPPHTDAVYMNRGTQNLFISWTPIGDIPREMGGLMVLEGSHHHRKLRENYSAKDVDKFCENRVGADFTEMGGGGNIRAGGWLSKSPAKLRDVLGGRWLSSEFCAGDVLIFSIFTVHASIDNQSDRIRLSSDSRYQLASEVADERWIGSHPIAHGPAAKRAMIC